MTKAQPVVKAAADDPNKPTDNSKIHLSNMYVEITNKYAAYNGTATFKLRPYSEEATYYLGRMYVVLPKGVTVAGTDDANRLDNFKQALTKYVTDANIHGNLDVSQLANTPAGRNVYQITPTAGTYMTKLPDGVNDKTFLDLTITTPMRDSGINQIVMNANTAADAASDVLFVGAGDGSQRFNDEHNYQKFSADTVGISGAPDQFVRGIVLNGIQRTLTMFEPKVRDTFNLVAADEPNELIDVKTHTDKSFEPYSLGFIKEWKVLDKDASADVSTLRFDGQPIPDNTILTTTEAFTNNPDKIMTGHTYTISYQRFAQPVTVNYIDGAGNKIADTDSIDTKLHVGDVYTLPTPRAIPGYGLRANSGAQQITLTKNGSDPINVTYVYDKIGQPVTVKYQDTKGKQITDSIILNGNVGDKYTTEQKNITGYDFQKVTDNASGTFSDEAQTVIYTYVKHVDPLPPVREGQPVIVQYQDANGHKLADDFVINGVLGTPFSTSPKTFTGYDLKTVVGATTGVLTTVPQIVTYVYAKIAQPVTVHYQDENGKLLADDVSFTGHVGDSYFAQQKDIPGFNFIKVIGQPTGVLGDTAQTVTFVYQRAAIPVVAGKPVTVHYQDAQGNIIAPDVILNGNIDESYITNEQQINGYKFQKVVGSPTGHFTDAEQTVTYIYQKHTTPIVISQPVVVHYVDNFGNPLAPDLILSDDIGTPFYVTPLTINGYHFSTLLSGSFSGTFGTELQELTLVYHKNIPDKVTPQPQPTPTPQAKPVIPIKPVEQMTIPKHVVTAPVNQAPINPTTTTSITPIRHQATTLPKTDQQNTAKLTIIGLIGLLVASFSWLAINHKRD